MLIHKILSEEYVSTQVANNSQVQHIRVVENFHRCLNRATYLGERFRWGQLDITGFSAWFEADLVDETFGGSSIQQGLGRSSLYGDINNSIM